MLVEPLPWQFGENRSVQLAAAETLVWYPLLALAVIGLVLWRRQLGLIAFPVLVAGGVAVMYGLAEGNFGTAYRHRGELVWAVTVIAAHGAWALAERRRKRRVETA
jgi:hypothetical protein